MTSPISITVPARAEFRAHPGQTVTIPLRVYDSGRTPVTVTAGQASITTLAATHPAAGWVTSVSPSSFTLSPGASIVVTLTMRIPAGAKGQHALNEVFRVQPGADPAGTVTTLPAAGTSVVVDLPGHDTHPAAAGVVVHPAAPAASPSCQ